MLSPKQQQHYDEFYASTHNNEFLDEKTEVLIGLASAMALNCAPCTRYYLEQARKAGASRGEVGEVLAKVMAVAAGQKRLQLQQVLSDYDFDLNSLA